MLFVPANSPVIDGVITRERLNSYVSVFGCTNDDQAMGAYYWNIALCSALYNLITAAEVTVRNSVDVALQPALGTRWWSGSKLHYKSYAAGASAPDPVKKLKDNFASAHRSAKKEKEKRYGIIGATPSHHEVIAKTDFSTWEYILDEEFLCPVSIWPKHLRKVFRGTWPSPSDKVTLRTAREAVADIRLFRNRVHHNEPAWKAHGVLNAEDAVQYVQGKILKIFNFIELIEPSKADVLRRSGVLAHANRIASVAEIRRYQKQSAPLNIKPKGKMMKLFSDDEATVAVVRGRTKRLFIVQPL
ncbi:hypothetical protein GCM10011324_46070 [Allosediminivita pacifica]|uniref:Abi-like protein n=2 Tax=Allosediminivita pacifica TaxID=1267769 RepID=A0A2T5ZV83_9RHOB|nr:CAAX protease [Allosediminivita pacifica]PTX35463.1 hypothetical protein C8N44_1782 [Allosediminivita pacifica]GGB31472.1 hypothetical protein GCM10011324_46070 [Allosediminivita pacifica]